MFIIQGNTELKISNHLSAKYDFTTVRNLGCTTYIYMFMGGESLMWRIPIFFDIFNS